MNCERRRARTFVAGASAVCLAAAWWCGHAWAQSVDYGTFEQIFGQPITTSVTGKPQKASDVPANLVILTQDDIRRSGADNIPDILRFVTGIDVRTYGLRDAEVGIRGYNQPVNPRLLVMVNGRQVYLDDYGYVPWSTIPVQLDEIRQIEVVKGPNSALFGFNAASGVINIITFDPLKDSTNAVTVRTGTQNLAEASVVGTAHLGSTAGLRVSAGGFSARDFAAHELDAFDSADRPQPRIGAFNLDGRWQVSPNVEMTAEGGVVQSRTGVAQITGSFEDYHYRIQSMRLGVSTDTRAGLFALDLYRSEARSSLVNPNPPALYVDNTVYVAKASDLIKLDADNTLRIGLEYRNNAANGAVFGGSIGYQVYSANAMWNWQVLPSVSITNAVRIDHLKLHFDGVTAAGTSLSAAQYNRTGLTEPSFNTGVVWSVTDFDTIRLTAARGLQVPSLTDYAFQLAAPQPGSAGYDYTFKPGAAPVSTLFYGNPALSPTAVWNLELGYDRLLPPIGSTVRSAVFLQRNDNLLAGSPSIALGVQPGHGYSSQSANIGSSDEMGFELGIAGRSASGWRWNASYSFASITDHLAGAYANLASFDYRHGTPQHTVILGGGYSVGRWEFDAQGRWQSSFQDFKSAPGLGFAAVSIPDYVTLNARIGYRLTDHVTLSGTAQQFNVSRVVESAGPPVERRLIAAVTAHF